MAEFKPSYESRRRHKRLRVALQAGVLVQEVGEPKPEYRKTENISSEGMFILAPEDRYPIGAVLKVWLELEEASGHSDRPPPQVQCQVQVVHLIHPKGFGVEIVEMAEADRELYVQALERYSQDPARVLPAPELPPE